jgi:hypothetical protein
MISRNRTPLPATSRGARWRTDSTAASSGRRRAPRHGAPVLSSSVHRRCAGPPARCPITPSDTLTVELIAPQASPAVVRLIPPEQPTITPTSYLMITIDAVVTMLATAAAELTRIRAREL